MEVYSTQRGAEVCEDIIRHGYDYGNNTLGLSDSEIDELRVLSDPLFGVDRLRDYEVGDDPERRSVFRKLASLGYAEVEE